MQFSTDIIQFEDTHNQHQLSQLTITNTTEDQITFKFKASTTKRFIIKPNSGKISPKGQLNVSIIAHREIIPTIEQQKIQIVFGTNLEQNHNSKFFSCTLVQAEKPNLNLTMVVQQKQNRIKQLEEQVNHLKSMPLANDKERNGKSGSGFGLKLIIVIMIGLMIGYFGPLKIFKKKVVVH